MFASLKFARIFWAIAILLMATGPAAQAYERFVCAEQCESEDQSGGSEQGDCPSNNTCCQCHVLTLLALAEVPCFLFEPIASGEFLDRDDVLSEGLAREIDYPPQLS